MDGTNRNQNWNIIKFRALNWNCQNLENWIELWPNLKYVICNLAIFLLTQFIEMLFFILFLSMNERERFKLKWKSVQNYSQNINNRQSILVERTTFWFIYHSHNKMYIIRFIY